MSIFVHVDDVGATESATRRVLDAWKKGLIDSFSILGNGEALPIVQSALAKHRNRPLRIGVHLNLSEGKSLTDNNLLAGPDENFIYGFGGLLWRWTTSGKHQKQRLFKEIENEWHAQIDKAKEICSPRKIDSLDGHIHIHMLPFLFPVAAKLALENDISEIRISDEVFHFSGKWIENISIAFLINILKYALLKICSYPAKRSAKKYELKYPDALIGILYTGIMTSSRACDGIKAAMKRGAKNIEVVFHIGRANKLEAQQWRLSKQEFQSLQRDKEYRELIEFRKGSCIEKGARRAVQAK